MSPADRSGAGDTRAFAPVFAALGDETRLTLLSRLGAGSPLSITRLTRGSRLTRQAVTKHLRVMQRAGLVRGVRRGRERLFELRPEPLHAAQQAMLNIARQWEMALARLKELVESPDPGV
ncbi:HTH-type transcriptional regulator [Phycisphaerae bacterium RAS1]|nr:HTH-type transcriptional regulator [Phycisphaerae bacterium RAS1]